MSDPNLINDIDCLLKCIRQPLPLDKFFKNISGGILNAKLQQLEFDNEETHFKISLKTKWKNQQISLTNKLVSPLGITITDKNQLIEKLEHDKFLDPESTLKESLKKNIDSHAKNSINLNIDSACKVMQERSLLLYENREAKVKITLFFTFLKIFIQKYTLTNKAKIFSPELLVKSATYLATLFASSISNFIFCLNGNLTFAEEPTEKSKKEQQETNISKMVFSYDQLLTKLTALVPNSEQKTIRQLLYSIIENSIVIDNKLISKYNFFKLAYFTETGFISVFGGYSGYDSIQICRKKLDSIRPAFQNFRQLIDELTTHVHKVPEIMDLSVSLKERADVYFQSLLYSSVFKKENKESLDRSAFEDFTFNIQNEISSFQKKFLPTVKITGALNKILNALFKCAPKFLISKEKRISFFQRKMPEVKLLDKVKNTVSSMKS